MATSACRPTLPAGTYLAEVRRYYCRLGAPPDLRFALGRELVPALRVLANFLLAFRREVLEVLVVSKNVLLLSGRQVAKPMKKAGPVPRLVAQGSQDADCAGLP